MNSTREDATQRVTSSRQPLSRYAVLFLLAVGAISFTVGLTLMYTDRKAEDTSSSINEAASNASLADLSPLPTLRVPSAAPTKHTSSGTTESTSKNTHCVINNILSIPDQDPSVLGSHEDMMIVTMDDNDDDICSYYYYSSLWCEHSGRAVYTNLVDPFEQEKADEKIIIRYPAEPHNFTIKVKHYFSDAEARYYKNETNDQEWVSSLSINTLSFDGTTQELGPFTARTIPQVDTNDPTGYYDNPDYQHDYFVILECDSNCACSYKEMAYVYNDDGSKTYYYYLNYYD